MNRARTQHFLIPTWITKTGLRSLTLFQQLFHKKHLLWQKNLAMKCLSGFITIRAVNIAGAVGAMHRNSSTRGLRIATFYCERFSLKLK